MRRAPGPGPIYVEADLTTQAAAKALGEHGLDLTRPALFVVEGVTMYLSEKVVRHQLRCSGVPGRIEVHRQPTTDRA